MAAVGRALINAINVHADPGWHPNDCPSEIVADLRAERDNAWAVAGRLWDALAAMVGSDDPDELERMLALMQTIPGPETDKTVSVQAIRALLETTDSLPR